MIENKEIKKYFETRKKYLKVLRYYKSHSENDHIKNKRILKRFILGLALASVLMSSTAVIGSKVLVNEKELNYLEKELPLFAGIFLIEIL